jgi:hypothetical protein
VNLLDMMNELGSRARYGVSPTDKYKLMMSGAVPGQPRAFLPSGDENPEAVRYLSNYLGAQQWGEGPTNLLNQIRYLIDDDSKVFGAGVKGAQAARGAPLQALMASLASGGGR